MNQERKKLGFELLLNNLWKNLGWMMLTNLLFAIPFIGAIAIAYVLCLYVLPVVPVTLPVAVILASPFYAGVVSLSREFSQGIKPDNMFKKYFSAVKENGLRFLLGGFLLYLAYLICYFSVTIYSSLASLSWIFYILLFVVIVICIFFLFMFYAVPLMTVSFDLKLKDIYKNSALMTFGEIKQNFFATIGVAAYLAVVLMPIMIISYMSSILPVATVKILLIAYGAIALGVLIPAPCAMIISNYLYPNMRSVIAGEDISENNSSAPAPDIRPRGESYNEDVSSEPEVDIDELRKGDGEEYIFYQGKMIKRKILIERLEETNND
ncbi:MAG: hypothetical protein IJ298_02975 [Ruminococcus sp.]|nr:hypothetical protein [Ruminococcus sp.]